MFRKTSFVLTLLLALGIASALSAQTAPRYGHMNLGNLLEELPETKTANESLKVFADKLSATDDSLTRAFQTAYSALEAEYKAGGLTPVQAQKRQEELQKQQEFIQKFEQEAQQKVSDKRDELLKPILAKINDAIKAVAKEAGYAMIFDTSSGVMLFAADTEDVTALVKKKLGI
ncbi:MAG TPA: OmpH family outer membrane protein [Saprospiraceae bacterium]|nr:OmpH family outer membrane protein [Saprospiraceae bacterium]HND87043.1 OmpH family outer membrane protein [Saprospiraceae bacterium]